VARALWVLHESMGPLISILAERLECEVEALDALFAMVLQQMTNLLRDMTALFAEQQEELRHLHGERKEEPAAA
jgi:hypothetical protein